MKKQDKIKEVLGNYYISADINGWISLGLYVPNDLRFKEKEIERNENRGVWRPKLLKGIENNNGWIKIESENDLKLPDGDYLGVFPHYYGYDNRIEIFKVISGVHKQNGVHTRYEITHYQPIQKPEPPIY